MSPGEAVIISRAHIVKRWLWYKLPQTNPVLFFDDLQECVSGTLDHLRNAVHRQMVSDVPLGAFLSGGLDSSSIVALAREINPDIQCFTVDVTGSSDDGFLMTFLTLVRLQTILVFPETLKIDSSVLLLV